MIFYAEQWEVVNNVADGITPHSDPIIGFIITFISQYIIKIIHPDEIAK